MPIARCTEPKAEWEYGKWKHNLNVVSMKRAQGCVVVERAASMGLGPITHKRSPVEVHEPNLHGDPKAILLHRSLFSSKPRSPSAAASVLPAPCCCNRAKLRQHPASLVACTSTAPAASAVRAHRQIASKARVESRRLTPARIRARPRVLSSSAVRAAAQCPS